MNLSEYKTQTLAREDVADIVRLEPVERDRNGNVIVLQTENGRALIKFDVHLMRTVDGITQFDKEQIAVIDMDTANEEVHFRAPSTAPKAAATPSQIEAYVNSLPFLRPRIIEMDTEAPWVKFEAIQATGPNAGREVTVFAYRDGANPPQYLILEK